MTNNQPTNHSLLTLSSPQISSQQKNIECKPRTGLEAEQKSFTDYDLDVIFRKRSLVFFTGESRYNYYHAIRGGFEVDVPGEGKPIICDFWGDMKNIIGRKEMRVSVVLAFGDVENSEL